VSRRVFGFVCFIEEEALTMSNDKRSSWDWYGVKIIKQIIVEGEPDEKLIDEFYDDDGKQHFEETLMLVRAQSFDHAYKIAENKATTY
jgi:hypothetical protein